MKDLYLEFTKSIYSPSRALLCNKRGNNMAHHFLQVLPSFNLHPKRKTLL